MQVRMVVCRTIQEAGRTLPLSVGGTYEVADPVGLALIASGAAEIVTTTPTSEPADRAPDPAMGREMKPDLVPETGRRRRR